MAGSINVNDYWVNQNQIPTLADVEDGIEQATLEGIDRTDLATGATLTTIDSSAPGSPVNGEEWNDISTLAGAPEVRPRIFDTASSTWLGRNVYYSATMPSTTTTGWYWYDMTLKLLRVYRAALYDPHGIAGWHPVSEGYQLWTNKSGGSISANRVVVQYTATAVERAVTTSTAHKDMGVVGVALEAISSDAVGVIAIVGGGAVVDIQCNVTSGNVALGDGIANSGVAGEGRTVGALTKNPNATAGKQQIGVPCGCFAQAQAAATGAGLVPCRLLGQVGEGALLRFGETTVALAADDLADANWDNTWRQIDLAAAPGPVDVIATAGDAKHKPILAALLQCRVQADVTAVPTNGDGPELSLGLDASAAMSRLKNDCSISSAGQDSIADGQFEVPTSDGTPFTALGNKFQWRGKAEGSGTVAIATGTSMRLIAYRY